MTALLDVGNALGYGLGLVVLVLGLRLVFSPRGCAGTVRRRTTRRTPVPARARTVVDLTDLDPAPASAHSQTPAARQPTDHLITATPTAGLLTHTNTGGTA